MSSEGLRYKIKSEISCEIVYGCDLVGLLFLKNPKIWFTIEDIEEFLCQKKKKMKRGSIYNLLSKLKRKDHIESRRSSFAMYRLRGISSENHPIGVGSRVRARPKLYKLDFFKYLETLAWEDVSKIHDIRLWTPVNDLSFVDKIWEDHPRSRYKKKVILIDSLRFELRVYYQAYTFTVSVACANKPIAVRFEGLVKLYGLLNNVRGAHCSVVPPVDDWVVKQWHYGRDTKGSVSGADFEMSFKDWFGDLVRIYTRNDKKVRIERVENPNVKVYKLLTQYGPIHDVQRTLEELREEIRNSQTSNHTRKEKPANCSISFSSVILSDKSACAGYKILQE